MDPSAPIIDGEWMPIAENTFDEDAREDFNWYFDASWRHQPEPNTKDHSILAYRNPFNAALRYRDIGDFAFEGDVQMMDGVFALRIYDANRNSYSVLFHDDNIVRLVYGEQELAQATITSDALSHSIRVEVFNHHLSVQVNSAEIMAQPLPETFRPHQLILDNGQDGRSDFRLDNLKVWRSIHEIAMMMDRVQEDRQARSLAPRSPAPGFETQLGYIFCESATGYGCEIHSHDTSATENVLLTDAVDELAIKYPQTGKNNQVEWLRTGEIAHLFNPSWLRITDVDATTQYDQLTWNTGIASPYCMDISPDGQYAVVQSRNFDPPGTLSSSEILLIDRNDNKVNTGFDAGTKICPQWSPVEQKWIAVHKNESGSNQLYLLDVSDFNNIQSFPITDANDIDDRVWWSPDGRKIAYISDLLNLVVLDLSSCLSDACQTTAPNKKSFITSDENFYDVSWHPDSTTLAVSTSTGSTNIEGRIDQVATLSIDADPASYSLNIITSSAFRQSQPRYSPDGNWIAVTTWDNINNYNSTSIYETNVNVIAADGDSTRYEITTLGLVNSDNKYIGAAHPFWEPSYNVQFIGHNGADWSSEEEADFRAGIQRTGEALELLLAEIGTNPASSPVNAFNRVMVAGYGEPILFIRTSASAGSTISIQFGGQTFDYVVDVACFTSGYDMDSNKPSAIVCSDDMQQVYREQTAVHELGHVLDIRTGNQIQQAMKTLELPNEPVGLSLTGCKLDSQNILVMGYYTKDDDTIWSRGRRGWQSTPYVLSEFTRHPLSEAVGETEHAKEQFEASGDMFLNWVYRATTSGVLSVSNLLLGSDLNYSPSQGCDTVPSSQTPTWLGFYNLRWPRIGVSGSPEYEVSMSGDVRQLYMQEVLHRIIDDKAW